MNITTAVEIEELVTLGEYGISEQLLKEGCSGGIHLTIRPDSERRGPCIHLSAWKQMSSFRLVAAKRDLRSLDDCWAVVAEAFNLGEAYAPSAEFCAKAQSVIDVCQPNLVICARRVIDRRAMSDFCKDLGLSLADVENTAPWMPDEAEHAMHRLRRPPTS